MPKALVADVDPRLPSPPPATSPTASAELAAPRLPSTAIWGAYTNFVEPASIWARRRVPAGVRSTPPGSDHADRARRTAIWRLIDLAQALYRLCRPARLANAGYRKTTWNKIKLAVVGGTISKDAAWHWAS